MPLICRPCGPRESSTVFHTFTPACPFRVMSTAFPIIRADIAAMRSCGLAMPRPVRSNLRQAGTLEHWLTERYCLYTVANGNVCRAEIDHAQWPLQDGE